MKKGKGGAIDGRGEKGLTTTFQGLATAQPGDEYEHDTSDEEVRFNVSRLDTQS